MPTIGPPMVRLLEVYIAAGLLFAPWFSWRGAARLDGIAKAGTWGFRLMILPAATVLWPYLILRLRRLGARR